jgi:translation initiation factor 3 subunit M
MFSISRRSPLPAVSSPSVPELSKLFSIFLKGDVSTFHSFSKSNDSILKEQGLDVDQLEKKLKLLALAELCSKRVGEWVSYADIAKALNHEIESGDDSEEVETWTIDGKL